VAGRYGIRRVPLHLTVDGVDYSDGVDEVPDDIVRVPGVSTSGANPHEIGEVFEEAVAASDGAGVVAVHISRRLSGTWSAARIAAEKFAGQVRVVDSRSVGLAVGFAAIAAEQAAETGADRDRVYEAAIRQAATLDSLYCVSTLDNLRASGRISAAGKMLGSALSIKPILHMVDGTMTLRERHRTFSKAIAKMQEGAVESAGGRAVTLGVQHCEAPELAREVADDLLEKIKTVTSSLIVEISPVLGCHVGPGAVGVVIGTHLDPIEGIPGD